MVALRQGRRGHEAGSCATAAVVLGVLMCTLLAMHGMNRVRLAVLGIEARPALPAADMVRLGVHQSAPSRATFTRAEVLASEDWLNNLRSEKFWASRKNSSGWSQGGLKSPPMALGFPSRGAGHEYSWSDGSYRTVCVRLCDGYFFPISASASSVDFEEQEEACARRCSSPAKLYVYKNGSEEPADMVDLKGQPYTRLKTAFLYRTAYDASCKCKPHPWEEASTDRHRMYALQADVKKGNRKAVAELDALKQKIAARDGPPPGSRKALAGKQKQASGAKLARKFTNIADAALSDDWEDAPRVAAGALPALEPQPRPKAASVKVLKPSTAAPAYQVKVSSREDDWRRRALGVR